MDAQRTSPQPLQSEGVQAQEDLWIKFKSNVSKTWRVVFEIIVIVLLVANLGSLNQLYKAINTLTEFNANAIMHPQIHKGGEPNGSTATSPAPTNNSQHKK